jgi:hypothetical protein
VAGKVGPSWLDREKRQEQVPRLDGLFEPVERLVVLARCEMDEREVRGRYVRLRGQGLPAIPYADRSAMQAEIHP